MNGTFQATAGFQDLDIFQKAVKKGFEMHFECEFSPFRIQTLTRSHPRICVVLDLGMKGEGPVASPFGGERAQACAGRSDGCVASNRGFSSPLSSAVAVQRHSLQMPLVSTINETKSTLSSLTVVYKHRLLTLVPAVNKTVLPSL